MQNKRFSERLNKELDNMGVPEANLERINALAKLLKLPKFQVESLLSGRTSPDPNLLSIIAKELEVSEDWLLGKTEL